MMKTTNFSEFHDSPLTHDRTFDRTLFTQRQVNGRDREEVDRYQLTEMIAKKRFSRSARTVVAEYPSESGTRFAPRS